MAKTPTVEQVFKRVHRAHGYGAVKRRPRDPDKACAAILELANINAQCGEDQNTILHKVVSYGARKEQSDATWNKGNESRSRHRLHDGVLEGTMSAVRPNGEGHRLDGEHVMTESGDGFLGRMDDLQLP